MEKFKSQIIKSFEKFTKMSKKRQAYSLAIFLVIFLMFWAFISAGVITSNFNRAQLKDSENDQKVDAKGVIITETKDGSKYFEIYGETGHYSNDHNIATLNNVIGNFYKEGEVAMSFQSSKGTYNEKEKIITLYENTYIVLKDGVSLNTDRLTWTGSDEDTVAEGNVVIRKNKEMASNADKCIISPNYEHVKIMGRTKTQIWGKGG